MDKITSVFEKSFNDYKNKKSITAKTVTLQTERVKKTGIENQNDFASHVSHATENLKVSLKLKETIINNNIEELRTELKSFVQEKKKSYGIFRNIILTIGKIFNIGAVARAKQLAKTMLAESNVSLIK